MRNSNEYVFTHTFTKDSDSSHDDLRDTKVEVSSDDENGVWISANRSGWKYLAKVCAEFSLDEEFKPGFHHKHFDAPVEVKGVENNELTFGLETWKRDDDTENASSGLYVYLVISDLGCDPDDVTKLLNKHPTSIQRINDVSPKTGKPYPFPSNCWQYDSDLKNFDIDLHVKHLYSVLGNLKGLESISKSWKIHIICVVDFRGGDDSPSLGVSAESAKILSEWSADIDVSYYLWGKVKGRNYKS